MFSIINRKMRLLLYLFFIVSFAEGCRMFKHLRRKKCFGKKYKSKPIYQPQPQPQPQPVHPPIVQPQPEPVPCLTKPPEIPLAKPLPGGSNGNVVYGNGNNLRGNNVNIYGNENGAYGGDSNIVGNDNTYLGFDSNIIGSDNKIVGVGHNIYGNGIKMFGPDAHPQYYNYNSHAPHKHHW